jgi:hypothetical protein
MENQKLAVWIGSSLDDLRDFPTEVRRVMGSPSTTHRMVASILTPKP